MTDRPSGHAVPRAIRRDDGYGKLTHIERINGTEGSVAGPAIIPSAEPPRVERRLVPRDPG